MSRQFNGWEDLVISDLVNFSGGSQPPKSTFVYEPLIGYVRLIQIRDYKTDKFATYVPAHLAQKFCNEDDIMIARYGPPIFQILRGLKGAYNVALIKAIPDETRLDKEYLYYFLQREELFRLIDSLSQRSSGQTGIDMEALNSFSLPLPPLPEQRKIAAILSTWDAAIALTEQVIGALQRRKQALMQVLLTGAVRFREFVRSDEYQATDFGSIPADWNYMRIGDMARAVSNRNEDGSHLPVLSCTKYDGLVDSLTYFGRQIFSDDLSTYKRVHRSQFAYATNHIEEGSIGYQDLYDVALISPMYTVFETTHDVDDSYLYGVLKTELYRHIFEINTSASVDRRGSLRWPQFSQIRVPLPGIDEQRAIAEAFQTAQELIETYLELLSQFQAQKRGLMQQLLTGAVRVGGE